MGNKKNIYDLFLSPQSTLVAILSLWAIAQRPGGNRRKKLINLL